MKVLLSSLEVRYNHDLLAGGGVSYLPSLTEEIILFLP